MSKCLRWMTCINGHYFKIIFQNCLSEYHSSNSSKSINCYSCFHFQAPSTITLYCFPFSYAISITQLRFIAIYLSVNLLLILFFSSYSCIVLTCKPKRRSTRLLLFGIPILREHSSVVAQFVQASHCCQ